jgi:ABC-type xylose transport system permease subunit
VTPYGKRTRRDSLGDVGTVVGLAGAVLVELVQPMPNWVLLVTLLAAALAGRLAGRWAAEATE